MPISSASMADGDARTQKLKQVALRVKSSGAPSEAQLTAIRLHTLADMPAEKLYVRDFVIAHNAIDRDRECFAEALLMDFARTLPGKGLYIKHPLGWDGDTGPAEGRFYDAQIKRMSFDEARAELREPSLAFPPDARDAVLLVASAYMVRTTDNGALLDKVDAGIAGDVSLGFFYKGAPERLVDAEGRELNAYRLNAPGEALEGSLVWLGAQPGARAIKNAPRTQETVMDPNDQKKLDDATAKALSLQSQLDAALPHSQLVSALKTALGEHAVQLDSAGGIAELGELITAGKAFKASLVDDVVKSERLLGLCGDDDAAVGAAKAAHGAMPVAKLQQLSKHYAERVPTGAKLAGGDPNHKPSPADKVPDALDSPAL